MHESPETTWPQRARPKALTHPPKRPVSGVKAKPAPLDSASALVARSMQEFLDPQATTFGHCPLRNQPLPAAMAAHIDQHMLEPVRQIAMRGGKGWRAAIALATCDALGGDSRALESRIGALELLHVGSLIVDDVQDASLVRRGGPTCHRLYDQGRAINAGSAAYFLIDELVEQLPIEDDGKVEIYRCFFRTLRAAHSGQAADLGGFFDCAREAIDAGHPERLAEMVLCMHRMKTGYPVMFFCVVGAVAAGAPASLRDQIANYGVAAGTAFQIGDDILGLSDFADGKKTPAEDIVHGKITYPIAMALAELDAAGGHALLDLLELPQRSNQQVQAIAQTVKEAGGVARARAHGTDLIETAWAPLDRNLAAGPAKERLRHYGTLLIDRHY